MKITIIGAGNMGLAMANGLKLSGFEVSFAGRLSDRLEALKGEFEVEIIDQNYDISDKNIILAIKPNALEWFVNLAKGRANSSYKRHKSRYLFAKYRRKIPKKHKSIYSNW